MVHGILQFTPSIAFRYVLHRCKSRDIRCRESLYTLVVTRRPGRTPSPETAGRTITFGFLGAFRAVVLLFGPGAGHSRPAAPGLGFVQWTSHNVAGSKPPTSPRSEHFTRAFNR
ncbi:hypothetical protein PIB30_106654, partial [Stylosanthes scabra]|nr:hypothetical protein [Stylosanthes scabra]